MPATPMSSSRWSTAREIKRALADRHRSAPHRRRICGLAHQLLALEGYDRSDGRRGVIIAHRRAARAPQSRGAGEQIFQSRGADRRAGRRSNGASRSTSRSRKSLGADRAVNAIAAHALHDGDLIVIDFGTATTFDVVDYRGAYKGGIIAPGINLSLDALVSAAAKLPRIAIEAPDDRQRDRPHHRGARCRSASIGAMSR